MNVNRRHFNRSLAFTLGAAVTLPMAGVFGILHQTKFGAMPSGKRLERIRKSSNWKDGAFRNREMVPLETGKKSSFRTMFEFLTRDKTGLIPSHPLPTVKTDLHTLPRNIDQLVWFGHSSYFLQLDGQRILVDPVFYAAAPFAVFNKAFPGTEIYFPKDMPDIDCLVITHDHWDHLDCRTVTELQPRIAKVICGLGVGAHLERWGFAPEKLIELDWEDDITLPGGLTFHCLPSQHFSGRAFSRNQTLWCSFVLETLRRKIFLGGDSGYGRHFKEIGKRFSAIDLAMIEDGQYNADWRNIHLMPEQFPKALLDLSPKRFLPIHNSKYTLSTHKWDEPIAIARAASKTTHIPCLLPRIGEVVFVR